MRKLTVAAVARADGKWDAKIEWYPSQTNGFAWEQANVRLSGVGRHANAGPWVAARCLELSIEHWIKHRGGPNTFAKEMSR